MLILLDNNPQIIINNKEIDNAICWANETAEEFCKRQNFDYSLFKRIYNNDLSVTLKELIDFANLIRCPLRDFVIIV